MDSQYGRTRFRDYSHAQLVAMLTPGLPAEVARTADGWRDLANLIDDVALTIQQSDAEFRGYWEGAAATAHANMLNALIDALTQVAFTARRIGDRVSAAGEALRRAQQRMAALGAPTTLTPPDQSVTEAASTPLPYGPARTEAAARQADAIRALQEYQRAQAAATTVAASAVAIMEELADTYVAIDLPRPPLVTEPPTIAPDGTPVYSRPPTPPAGTTDRPLFADFWRNGLLAAAGLPAIQLLRPFLPVPGGGGGRSGPGGVGGVGAGRNGTPSDVDPLRGGPGRGGVNPDGTSGSGGVGGVGFDNNGFGGGVNGYGGGFGGADSALAPAVGQSSLAPVISPADAAAMAGAGGVGGVGAGGVGGVGGVGSVAGGVGGAAGLAAGPGGAGVIPPFLGGFAPPGGGDLGRLGGSSIGAWLIGEVEEFGVRTPVVPEVID